MNLPVLDIAERLPDGRPWYADGLAFACTQCGNCCTGPPGYVWVNDDEVSRLADHLGIAEREVRRRYCRKLQGRVSLKERRNDRGQYDCIFLTEAPAADGRPARRTCSIYPVRPLQCRTWPFWPGLLRDRQSWALAKRTCPGMDAGKTHPRDRIERLATAADWPDR